MERETWSQVAKRGLKETKWSLRLSTCLDLRTGGKNDLLDFSVEGDGIVDIGKLSEGGGGNKDRTLAPCMKDCVKP